MDVDVYISKLLKHPVIQPTCAEDATTVWFSLFIFLILSIWKWLPVTLAEIESSGVS